MVKYICERCGKEFYQKSYYDSHNRSKTPCENNAYKIMAPVDKVLEEQLIELNKKLIIKNEVIVNTEVMDNTHKLQKPLLKWVGGKTQIIKDIISKIPTQMNNYHELFLGGGSVLLAVLSLQKQNKIVIKNKIYAYDINSVLINVYKNIQKNKDELYTLINLYVQEYNSIEQFTIYQSEEYKNLINRAKLEKEFNELIELEKEFNELINEDNKKDTDKLNKLKKLRKKEKKLRENKKLNKEELEIIEKYKQQKKYMETKFRNPKTIEEAKTSKESYYYWIRNQYNNIDKNTIDCSALFIFINKSCFRGIYREGPKGFNVPFGHYEKISEIISKTDLNNISDLIKNVEFKDSSFTDSIKNIKEGDFVYIDPPYAPEKPSSFVGYVADGFNLETHQILFDEIKKMENIKFVMSNAKVRLVTDNFKTPKYKCVDIEARRAINSKKPDSITTEVIINN